MPHPATGVVQLSDVHLRIGPRDGESARRLEATVRAVSDLPGVGSQLALDLDPFHDRTFTDAAPGFAFHALVAGDIASHVERVEPMAPRATPSE